MELIRRWVLVLCVSAVLASVLQSVLPEKGSFSVIKLVLSLYILITLISPVREFSAADLSGETSRLDLPTESAPKNFPAAEFIAKRQRASRPGNRSSTSEPPPFPERVPPCTLTAPFPLRPTPQGTYPNL